MAVFPLFLEFPGELLCILAEKFNRRAALGAANTDLRDILTCILLGTVLCVIIFIWFHFYEGREVSE